MKKNLFTTAVAIIVVAAFAKEEKADKREESMLFPALSGIGYPARRTPGAGMGDEDGFTSPRNTRWVRKIPWEAGLKG